MGPLCGGSREEFREEGLGLSFMDELSGLVLWSCGSRCRAAAADGAQVRGAGQTAACHTPPWRHGTARVRAGLSRPGLERNGNGHPGRVLEMVLQT